MKNAFFAVALSLVVACGANLSDVVQAKQAGGGTVQVYNVLPQQAWEIARGVLHSEGTEQLEEHPAEGYMLTSALGNGLTSGCYVGVWIEGTAPAPYSRVTVVTKRKSSFNAMTGLTESTFHRDFAQAVATHTPVQVAR